MINTHSHFDHTGGNGFFKEIYMDKQASKSAKNYMDEDPTFLPMDYEIRELSDKFDLKGRELEIIKCDVHSPGNIMILDKTHRILFTGDEMDKDQVLLLPGFAEAEGQFHTCPAATVKDYHDMLVKVWCQNNAFDILCTGHNGSPLDKGIILDMIELCQKILSGEKGKTDCSSPTYSVSDTHFPCSNAHYLRYEYKGLALVYCGDDLRVRSNNSRVPLATPLHEICSHTTCFIDN